MENTGGGGGNVPHLQDSIHKLPVWGPWHTRGVHRDIQVYTQGYTGIRRDTQDTQGSIH